MTRKKKLEKMPDLQGGEELMTKQNDFEGHTELKAGNLAHFFSQLDPNTSVYNTGEASFAVAASDDEINHLANVYGCNDEEPIQYFDNDDDPTIYGNEGPEIQRNVSDYHTNDFVNDNRAMDTNFAKFIADQFANLSEDVANAVVDRGLYVLDNLVNYQNTKNLRSKIELVEVARRVK